jgi:hypothetical protein
MEGDGDMYQDFDSSKVTKVLKVFLSKSQKRVVAKCEQERDADKRFQPSRCQYTFSKSADQLFLLIS